MIHTGGGQTDSVVVSGREGRRLEFSHRQSNSPLGSPLMIAALSQKNDVHCHFINKGSKEIKDK